jgi:DNA replication protein DnaC
VLSSLAISREGGFNGQQCNLVLGPNAQAAGRLQARLKVLTHPALLVVDEIGYLPITRTGAMLFFQLMTRRYEHASTVLTSNKGFEEWGTSSAMTSWPPH